MPELNAGGVERTTLEMAEALHMAGHIAHVCSNGGRMEPEFQSLGTRLHSFNVGSKNPFMLRRHTKKLIEIIKSEHIDIVHARSRAPAWPAHAAAKATGRAFLTTYHGIYNARSGAKKRYNAIMSKGDLIIANSGYTKAHIVKEHGTDPQKIRVIPRGVDMLEFDPAKVSDENAQSQKRAWGLQEPSSQDEKSKSEKIILLPARLTRWKGQLVAIEALAELPEDWFLIMMGDPQGREHYVKEIEQKAKQLGVFDRIRMPGHSRNVPAAIQAATIVIAPSIEPEAFGRTVIEAQAMGRPVIATRHGGPMETVLDGTTGLLIPPSDPKALARAVKTINNWPKYNPGLARDHVSKNFSKKQLQEKTLAVYEELLM